MTDTITLLLNDIQNTGLIERFGGWCFNMTDKDLPYGVAITNTDKGTLYGMDENFESTAYLWVKSMESTGFRNQVEVTVVINIYTPFAKWSSTNATYYLPLLLKGQLFKKWKDIKILAPFNEQPKFQEFSQIEIKFVTYAACTIPSPLINWDFEGTLTVGEFEGEGGIMEYGYRAGFGDDYGVIANFYTYYEYSGLYWIENETSGTLYLWGVNCTKIKIGDILLENGTYNSEGYTEWTCDNPFTGATTPIKIKGTVTEVWDYEGILTVGYREYEEGEFPLYIVGYHIGQYLEVINFDLGELNTPFIGWSNEGSQLKTYIAWNNEESFLNVSSFVRIVKIDGLLFMREYDDRFFMRSCDNPFPAVGETCTIKIKL